MLSCVDGGIVGSGPGRDGAGQLLLLVIWLAPQRRQRGKRATTYGRKLHANLSGTAHGQHQCASGKRCSASLPIAYARGHTLTAWKLRRTL